MPGTQSRDQQASTHQPISEVIRRARLGRGLSPDRLARRLAELAKDPCATGELVVRWERGARIPGPYWRDLLGQALDLPGGLLERAAASARIRRALAAAGARPAGR